MPPFHLPDPSSVWLAFLDAMSSALHAIPNAFHSAFSAFAAWISQPHVYAAIFAFTLVFTIAFALLCSLGFGPAGIVGGSLMAAFQSLAYGAFTPAAGLFAWLTSLGMMGWANPVFALLASVPALLVAVVVWNCVSP